MISSRMRCLRCFLILVLVVSAAGCAAPLLLVGAGAVGGYAVSGDTFEGVTSKSEDEIWDAAHKVASIMGTIEEDNRHSGQMTARINGARVTITVVPVNLNTTKLRIKARKGIFPRIGTAQEVYAKINAQLEE